MPGTIVHSLSITYVVFVLQLMAIGEIGQILGNVQNRVVVVKVQEVDYATIHLQPTVDYLAVVLHLSNELVILNHVQVKT